MEHFLTSVMTSHGYLALIIFGLIEACCIPISSEVTFAFAGLLAYQGKYSLALVIVIGTAAEMAGSILAYWIGRGGGRRLLYNYGRWVLVSRHDLERAESFFASRGSWAVLVGRAMFLVRTFAGFGAGVVEVPFGPYVIFDLIGTVIFATALSLLGYNLGPTVTKFFHSFSLVGIVLVVLLLAGLIAHRVHAIRKDAHRQDSDAAQPATQKVPAGRPGAHRSGRNPSA